MTLERVLDWFISFILKCSVNTRFQNNYVTVSILNKVFQILIQYNRTIYIKIVIASIKKH